MNYDGSKKSVPFADSITDPILQFDVRSSNSIVLRTQNDVYYVSEHSNLNKVSYSAKAVVIGPLDRWNYRQTDSYCFSAATGVQCVGRNGAEKIFDFPTSKLVSNRSMICAVRIGGGADCKYLGAETNPNIVLPENLKSQVVDLSLSETHLCAKFANQNFACFGENGYNQLNIPDFRVSW